MHQYSFLRMNVSNTNLIMLKITSESTQDEFSLLVSPDFSIVANPSVFSLLEFFSNNFCVLNCQKSVTK